MQYGFLIAQNFFALHKISQMVGYYRDPHGDKMMKDLTGAHSIKLQRSGFGQQSGTAEQERVGTLQRRLTELEGELKIYKARPCNYSYQTKQSHVL